MSKKKQTNNKKQKNKALRSLVTRLREGFFILIITFAVLLLLALMTYHSGDPGWSYTGSGDATKNIGGRLGAWFADAFLYLFGFMAYFFPLLVAHHAWLIFKGRDNQSGYQALSFTVRFLGGLFIVIAGAGLMARYIEANTEQLPGPSGGLLGGIILDVLVASVSEVGASIVLLAIFLVGVTFFTGFSWLKLTKLLMRMLAVAGYKVWHAIVASKARVVEAKVVEHSKKDIRLTLDKSETSSSQTTEKVRIEPIIGVKSSTSPAISDPIVIDEPNILPLRKVSGALPPVNLLIASDRKQKRSVDKAAIDETSRQVELKLQDFGVDAQVVSVHPGPVVTRFELQLAPGVKASKVTGLAKDLARSLLVPSVRVVEVIPGKSVIGLELPNDMREIVRLRDMVESEAYNNARSLLSLTLGKDIAGYPIVVDLAKMPHLLVAGTTGSGKSVGINVMLISLLYKATPEDVRLLMVDPKMLELSVYEGIPHLLTPVVTDMKEAINALRWCVNEMEQRYRLMAALGVRNLAGFNKKVKEAKDSGAPIPDPFYAKETDDDLTEVPHLEKLPYIVVVIDELADMMMVVGKKVDQLIARIAQKARAAGIHLILSTQRPSVDVITGLIKANIPTRIAFQVSSRIDSRTILDQQGAEHLLGHGDMLYLPPGSGIPVRVHGALVEDQEVHDVVSFWKKQGEPSYYDGVLEMGDSENSLDFSDKGFEINSNNDEEKDELFDKAVYIVTETRKASISNIQRRLKIGYNRAARLIETMEKAGIVSEMENNGSRSVLAPPPPKN